MSNYIIKPEDITKFLITINVTGDWLSSRDPQYPINSASKLENRYNRNGDVAYYIASGEMTMKAEVPKWKERDLYHVAPTTIHAFDTPSWSSENGCYEDYLKSKEEGGHGLCQKITDQLTGVYGLSGILYNSQPMHAAGQTGFCLVVLPPSGQLVDGTFFVKDLSHVAEPSKSARPL
ncbi:MAG: hypothetical protein J0L73_17990 [Verrucomicrobia bacterium]|nr:hypothetical protein [Verrucomicrobiota bacterium]